VVRAQWPERFAALATGSTVTRRLAQRARSAPTRAQPLHAGRVAGYVGKAVLVLLLLLPPRWWASSHTIGLPSVGFVATGMAKGAEDALASIKVLARCCSSPSRGPSWRRSVWRCGASGGTAGLRDSRRSPPMQPWCSSSGSTASSAGRGAQSLRVSAVGVLAALAERHAIREEIVAARAGGGNVVGAQHAAPLLDAIRSGSSLPPGFHFLHESSRDGPGRRCAPGSSQLVWNVGPPNRSRWPGRADRALLEPTLTDVHSRQVIHRQASRSSSTIARLSASIARSSRRARASRAQAGGNPRST